MEIFLILIIVAAIGFFVWLGYAKNKKATDSKNNPLNPESNVKERRRA